MKILTKTTVYLPESEYERLKEVARARNRPTAECVREAVVEYVRRHGKTPKPTSLGAGCSGRGDLSEQSENLLEDMGR